MHDWLMRAAESSSFPVVFVTKVGRWCVYALIELAASVPEALVVLLRGNALKLIVMA